MTENGALPAYAELHCLSNFSFLRGASHPEELVARAHQLGYSALAITDECSFAGVVRAHTAAKECGLPLILGSEIRLGHGPQLVLLATDRDGYGNLSELITRGRRRGVKGRYVLEAGDLDQGLPGCLHCSCRGRCRIWSKRAGSPNAFPGAPGSPWNCCAERATKRASPHCAHSAQPALCRSWPQATCTCTCARGASCRTRSPPSVSASPLAQCGQALYPNAERHLRLRLRLANLYPRDLLEETLRIAARCSFSLDCLRYEYPEEIVPPGATPSGHLRALTAAGLARRFPMGVPEKVRALIEHELATDRRARLRALLSDRARHRGLRAQQGHPLPGPRLGREFGGVLRAGHHRSRSGAHEHAVRAFHFARAQRAARHRRRLRAPAARRSDPVHIRQVRARARGAGRDGDPLPAEERDPRLRQGARPGTRPGRAAGEVALLVGPAPEPARAPARSRLRSDQPDHSSPARAGGCADRFSAPPVAACRRLRHRARPAVAPGADRERRHGRAQRDPVGQGRSRCAWAY